MSEETIITPKDARALLEQDKQARAQRVQQSLQALLEKERCALELFIESIPLGNGLFGQRPGVRIVARE